MCCESMVKRKNFKCNIKREGERQLQKISKMDTVIFRIYDHYQNHKKPIRIIMLVVDLLLFLYYLLFFNPGMWPLPHEEVWNAIYAVLNPFTTGAYILGAAILLQYMMYDDWIVKALLGGFYGWIILISCIVIMGMTSLWELCIYVPHLMVAVLCGIVTRSKQRIRARGAAAVQDQSVKES